MKSYGEIQYENEKTSLLTGNYNNRITFSLNTLTKEDLSTIHKIIQSSVYLLGRFGLHFIKDFHKIVSHTYRGLKNEVKLERHDSGLVNIFIMGPKADEIERDIFDYKKVQRLEQKVA